MVYNLEKHHRRSIRLERYDYSQIGMYFITICVNQRECLLGEVVEGKIFLSEAGVMVQTTWNEIPNHYPGVDMDAFVVMPNHIHGIIVLKNVGVSPCAYPVFPLQITEKAQEGQPQKGQPQGVVPTGLSLSDVVHRFKTLTTKHYTDGVRNKNWKRFYKKLWQRNYYEHIIRNEYRFDVIRKYIDNNPLKWEYDTENPNEKPIEEKRKFWKVFLEM